MFIGLCYFPGRGWMFDVTVSWNASNFPRAQLKSEAKLIRCASSVSYRFDSLSFDSSCFDNHFACMSSICWRKAMTSRRSWLRKSLDLDGVPHRDTNDGKHEEDNGRQPQSGLRFLAITEPRDVLRIIR